MEVRKGYKKTEVGVIPEDWDCIQLGNIGDCIIGLTYKPSDVKDYGRLVLRSSNINENRLVFTDNVYVDIPIKDDLVVQENDILICVRNGSRNLIGKCALIDKKSTGQTFGAFMSVFRSIYGRYLLNCFQSSIIKKQLNEIMGATINQITNKDLKSFYVPLPNNDEEQQAIAEALSDVDSLISSLTKLINKKKKIKQGVMQILLTGKKRLEGFSRDWEKNFLGEIADASSGGTPSRSNPNYYSGNIPWVTTSELNDKSIHDTNEHITQEAVNSSSAKIFPEYTVLIAMYGATIGKLGILAIPASTNQACCALICNKEILDYRFLFYKLLSMREYIISLGCGAGQPNISQKIIKSLEISIPMLPEQTAIASILSDMDAEIEALEQKLNKYKAIKQGMMQELLTGKIRLI